jgi:hypothetical protein
LSREPEDLPVSLPEQTVLRTEPTGDPDISGPISISRDKYWVIPDCHNPGFFLPRTQYLLPTMEKILLYSWTVIFGLAFFLALPSKTGPASTNLAKLGALVALGYIFVRYYRAWPMTPMFMGSVAVAPFLVIFGLITFSKGSLPGRNLGRGLVFFLAFFLGILATVWPKDFYLPFLKTASIFSQAHLAFNFLGKAAFLISGIWGLLALLTKNPKADSQIRLWLAVGFVFWTMSMLTGEVWSYLGWGLPVVWDEAVIVCFMATWFFYTALLHLFLTGRHPAIRQILAASGLIWIVVINILPDLGPTRWPPELSGLW